MAFMSRLLRIEYPGDYYHVMSQGTAGQKFGLFDHE
jgi:hypothetical protein